MRGLCVRLRGESCSQARFRLALGRLSCLPGTANLHALERRLPHVAADR
jgi:hypothetical protein